MFVDRSRRFVHSANNEREIKTTLSLSPDFCDRCTCLSFDRFLFDWLFEEGKNNTTDGEMSYGFRINSRRPTRERNLESVSSGPVGKASLHISYMGVHSCASILASPLSTRFLHSLPQHFSTLVTCISSYHRVRNLWN